MARAAQLAVRSEGEALLEFPCPLEPITAIRSTLITSSLASLRLRDLLPRYEAAQQSPHRETILRCVAGEWLPLEVGFAHYRACDALGLSPDEQVAIGKDVSRRIHDTFLSTVAKMARGAGVTPWLLLAKGNTLQSRLYRGGGMRIVRLAAKSARVELARHGLLELPYYRNAVQGVYTAGVELLGSNVSCRILRAESSDPGRLLVLRIDWE
ncbi:MAG: hypothetical protein RL033_686 [Pseudomonadota bacterium]|jgi:hypothetical protein